MFFPGFEPKNMSDDEIMRKTSDLQGKMVFAYGTASYGMVEQMQMMLEALRFEQQERLSIKLHEMRERMYKDVIETEPDLVVRKEVEQKKKVGKNNIATFFPPKTKKPGGADSHQPENGLPPKTSKPS